MHTNKGECCRSQALHQPWPKESLALNLLARLRKPLSLDPRHWSPRCKTKPGADMKLMCNHTRHCCRRANTKQRHCHKSMSLGIAPMRANANLFGGHERRHNKTRVCSRHHCKTTSTMRHHKGTLTRVPQPPGIPEESHQQRTFSS